MEVTRLRQHLEHLDQLDAWHAAAIGQLLDLARELDRQRRDLDHSGHTLAMVARAYGEALDRIRPALGADDSLDLLLAELTADADA